MQMVESGVCSISAVEKENTARSNDDCVMKGLCFLRFHVQSVLLVLLVLDGFAVCVYTVVQKFGVT